MEQTIKKFYVKPDNWKLPIILRAYNTKDAKELFRTMFKIPSNQKIYAEEIKPNA